MVPKGWWNKERRKKSVIRSPKPVNLNLAKETRKILNGNKSRTGESYSRYVERTADHMLNYLFMNTTQVSPGVYSPTNGRTRCNVKECYNNVPRTALLRKESSLYGL